MFLLSEPTKRCRPVTNEILEVYAEKMFIAMMHVTPRFLVDFVIKRNIHRLLIMKFALPVNENT